MAVLTHKWWRTATVGLAAAAVCVLASIQPAHAKTSCRGTVRVTDTATGKVAGFVGRQLNSYGEYGVAARARALKVAVGSGESLTAVNSSDPTYPEVGGIEGFYTKSPNLSSKSANYSTLGATARTKAAAKPAKGRNSYSDATGMPEDIESAIWSVGKADALTPTWINSGGTHAPTHLVEIEGVLVLTGDPTALAKELGQSATRVSLRVIPTSGGCT